MNRRQTKKRQKKAVPFTAKNTAEIVEPIRSHWDNKTALTEFSEKPHSHLPSKVFVTRNSHTQYPYALVDETHNLIANLTKISDARSYCKEELKANQIEIIRNLSFTYQS